MQLKQIQEIGTCPSCQCSLMIYKTNNYKRFVKCDGCGLSYPLPKRGTISNSALECPKGKFPLLIVERANSQAYFWSDRPCFNCIESDKCSEVEILVSEFKELQVYGY